MQSWVWVYVPTRVHQHNILAWLCNMPRDDFGKCQYPLLDEAQDQLAIVTSSTLPGLAQTSLHVNQGTHGTAQHQTCGMAALE